MENQTEFMREMERFKKEFQQSGKFASVAIIIALMALGLYTSIYTVEPDEEAVKVRFGRYVGTYGPGPHLKLPFGVEKIFKLQTTRVLQEEFGFRTKNSRTRRTTYDSGNYDDESLMLTGDLNVADVEWVVHYKISDPFKFLFQTSEPITNIRDVSESIMRRVVGDRAVNETLTTGRKDISIAAKGLIQEVLDKYDMGVNIMTVKLQDVNPPERVKASFNEVNEAKQEQEKVINQAEKSYNEIIPEARGKADKLISEAQGYAESTVNRAKGDAEKFLSVVREYRKAPSITKKRLYIEAMEHIFSKLENVTVVDPNIKGLMPLYNKIPVEAK